MRSRLRIPCLSALRLDLAFPAGVLGPMDRCALQQFAAIRFSVAVSDLLRNLPTHRFDTGLAQPTVPF